MFRLRRRPRASRVLAGLLAASLIALASGCGPGDAARFTVRWHVARQEPAFDPDGPPYPLRQAIERLLTRPLLTRDSTGVIGDAAEDWSFSPDSLSVTFRLRAGLRFTDGSPCRSLDFARALRGGLGRPDHGTRTWELGSVRGVDLVRPRRPLPAIGIETPDSLTLVLRLTRRDPSLLVRLSRPGVAEPWKDRAAAAWKDAIGLGPMRVSGPAEVQRLTLIAAVPRPATPDTIAIRFAIGEGRTRAALRAGTPDLVWPLPPALLDEPLPAGYRVGRRLASHQLLLVMRADLPPASRIAARRALSHGINRPDLLRTLGFVAAPPGPLIPGAGALEAPGFDLRQMRLWMEQGKLGRSFHVALAFDADGPASRLARSVQESWARGDVDVELMPRRGDAWSQEALVGKRSHLLFVEHAPLVPGLAGVMAPLVMPARGPAVGGFRTGWRTREFDRLLAGAPGAMADPEAIRVRLEQDAVVLPLASLATEWVEREGAMAWRFGAWPGPSFARGPISGTRGGKR